MATSLIRLTPVLLAAAAATQATDKLEDLGAPVINIALEHKAQAELGGIVKLLRLDLVAGGSLPRNLASYLRQNMDSQGTDVTKDPWETPYELVEEYGAVYVRSCGPDRLCGSRDDVYRAVVDPQGRYRDFQRTR
jgi:hypothetical protein